jgi:hypothetical protein
VVDDETNAGSRMAMEDVIANPESRSKLVDLMQRMGKLSSRMEPNG